MKKIILVVFIGVLMLGILSGCTNEAAKIDQLEQENVALQKELKIVKEKYNKEVEIRYSLNIKSFEVINAMINKDIDTVKKYLSKDTICLDDRIKSENYEYQFSEAINENRVQTYWHYEDENTFFIGYSIMGFAEVAAPLTEEEFEYRLEDGEWKLVGIAQQ